MKPDAFRDLYSHMPTRPDSNARVWGVNSFVRLRVHWGEFSEDVAQTAGYSTPSVQNLKTSSGSGFRFSVVDYDAVAPVPGAPRKGAESSVGTDGKMGDWATTSGGARGD